MKRLWREIIESLIAAVLVFVLTITNLFSALDYIAKDACYQIPKGITSQIKIIAIDERTLEEMGPMHTWSRQVYADVINKLNSNEAARPAVIGFDIQFSGYFGENQTITDGDMAFAEAAAQSGNIVTVAQLDYDERLSADKNAQSVHKINNVYYPYEELRVATQIGYSNVAQDSDGVVRRIIPEEKYNGQVLEMFPKVVYETYCEATKTTPNEIKTDKYGRSLINYSGRPGDYEVISLIDFLNGKIDSKVFADSIVLVGAYAAGMQDNFKVPNGKSQQMYGVEIYANILQAFMENRFSVNANPYLCGAILGVLCGISHFVFRRSKIWLSLIVLLCGIAGEVFLGIWLNQNGYAINLIYFPIVLIISYVYSLGVGYLLERIKRYKVVKAFKKYVAPEVVEEISKKGDFTIKLGGENKDIAVLFVDIRGFTTMSEILEPEKVVEILNSYLNLTTNAIYKNRGTLDKFVGDATMAVFNSPFDLDDYEYRAVCTAMDIVKGGEALEQELMEKYGRTVGFGVGVNCGPAVVGNIGCDSRMDFTAIGDTVNTAARLESNAKKGQVLISDALYERVKDRIEVSPIGDMALKGKAKNVYVYEVLSVKGGK